MSGKTFVITGGNSGLGFETAKQLAKKNQDNVIILGCRCLKKGHRAVEDIKQLTGNQNIEVIQLDLCELESVKNFAEEIRKRGIIIDGLDNNAGISGTHTGLTKDGIDVVFQSNHLGHFLLTKLLLPYMAKDGRIVNISSDMHQPPYGKLVWKGAEILAYPTDDLKDDRSRYFYSKLCNLYLTYELNDRLRTENSQITVCAFNPGFMGETNLSQGITKEQIEHVKHTMPERYGELPVSAQAIADILTDEQYMTSQARYYNHSTNAKKSSELSYNKENAQELWELSMKLVEKILGKE